MERSLWLIIAAVIYAVFGLSLVLIPVPFTAMHGIALDPGGVVIARILGSALLGFALVFWWGRNEAAGGLMTAVLRASAFYNAVDFFVVLSATLAGTMNVFGWVPAILHIVLAAGFSYFVVRG